MKSKIVLAGLLSMIFIVGSQAQKDEKQWAIIYSDGKFGIIGKSGAVLIKPEYEFIGKLEDKLQPVIKSNELFSLNEKGQRTPYNPAVKGDPLPYSEGAKWGLKNKKEEVLLKPTYEFIGKFDGGLAKIFLAGKMGLVNDKGKVVLPPTYDYIFDFEKGRAIILSEFKHGLIDEKGTEIVPPIYDKIQKIGGDNYLMLKDNLWGVLNKNGHEKTPPAYQAIFKCKEGYKTVFEGKTGMLTDAGDVIFEPYYDFVDNRDNNVFITVLNGKYGLLNKNGKIVVEPTYDDITIY